MIKIKKKKKPTDWIPSDKTESKPERWSDTSIARKKLDIYTVSGVDEAEYYGITDTIEIKAKRVPPPFYTDEVKKEYLIRPTDRLCPVCDGTLYNTKLDGIYFYCPECKKQYHIKKMNDAHR